MININTGECVGGGEEGELCIKGPQIMLEYLNRPKATANTVDEDGWLHTGTLLYILSVT